MKCTRCKYNFCWVCAGEFTWKKSCLCYSKDSILRAPASLVGIPTSRPGDIYIALFHTAIVYGLAKVATQFLRHVLVSFEASMSDSSFAYIVSYIIPIVAICAPVFFASNEVREELGWDSGLREDLNALSAEVREALLPLMEDLRQDFIALRANP